MKRYLKNKSFLTGAILAFIMLGMLVVSLFWLPYDPEEMYLAPSCRFLAYHILWEQISLVEM